MAATSSRAPESMKVFTLVWAGQLVSTLGSGVGSFALGVWVLQTTESVTRFSLIAFFATLPGLLLAPITGALADRWDRRLTMMLTDLGAALCTLTIAGLYALGLLRPWHAYGLVALITAFGAFQQPAAAAATIMIVPTAKLAKAAGMNQISGALSEILAPLLAASLLGLIGLSGVMLIDFSTFLVAAAVLLLVRIPRPVASAEGAAGRGSLFREAWAGWAFVAERAGLRALLVLYAASNVCLGMIMVLLTPLVLSFSSTQALGRVMSISSVGLLLGSIAVGTLGAPRRRVPTLLAACILQGLLLIVGGSRASTGLITAAAFAFLLLTPLANACDRVLWQTKVPADMQGRIFAVRRVTAGSLLPVAYLAAGPLADRVFEPLLLPGGGLAGTVGTVIGVGRGRGIGLLVMLLGVLLILISVVGWLYPRLRNVEREVPDAPIRAREEERGTPTLGALPATVDA